MPEFNSGDPKRIQHFLKVYEFAHVIGVSEGLDAGTQRILDMASIMHDIGIRPSEEIFGTKKCNEVITYSKEQANHSIILVTELVDNELFAGLVLDKTVHIIF